MTDIKLGETDGPAGERMVAEFTVNPWSDWAARGAIVIVFTAFAIVGLAGIPRHLPVDGIHKLLMVAASIANVMFVTLVASTTLTRLTPIQKARGIEPRISALLGTFLCITLAFLPKAELGPIFSAASTALILIGASLSFAVLRWLGKSFSILAEARRLVTEGPYRIVRHPLYVCEGVVLVGVALQVLSPLAVLIAIAAVMVQCRRMINEETILTLAFPQYRAYAATTPFLIPSKLSRLFTRSN